MIVKVINLIDDLINVLFPKVLKHPKTMAKVDKRVIQFQTKIDDLIKDFAVEKMLQKTHQKT